VASPAAEDDLIAFGALLAFREAGLHFPEDISLIGFDNPDLAEMTSLPLSSVSQSGYHGKRSSAEPKRHKSLR
jgi:LacI family transcriptional regulator